MYTVDSALQHTCAEFREQAARGEISGRECDLLIDGAILLAVHFEALIQDAMVGRPPGWPEAGPGPATPSADYAGADRAGTGRSLLVASRS
ncbi:MAG TPA: hypothetical protein VF834_11525 [Streptosporangiaceae bacterium]